MCRFPGCACCVKTNTLSERRFLSWSTFSSRVLEDITLPGMTPEERHAIYFDMIRVLAALHSVDYAALGLDNFGKPGNYFSRQIGRWSKQYVAAKTDEIESMERLMEYLPANVPHDDTSCIVHGDYRMGNMLLHPTEPKIVALLDWELSTLGHPLGRSGLQLHVLSFRDRRTRTSLEGLAGSQSGIPSQDEFVAEYCRLTGRDGIPNWNFYLAFSFFRLASILQGVYKRGIMGNASSTEALERGRMAREIADIAWQLLK